MTVSPFVDGVSSPFGPYESAGVRRRMGGILGRLHAATEIIDCEFARTDDLALPSRHALEDALSHLDRPWKTGPFAEPARHLLRTGARGIAVRVARYDGLATQVRATAGSWVITHGEPHRANMIRDTQGGIHLVDWDTTLIAPRERDLRMVLDEDLTGLSEYVAEAGDVSLSPTAIELYDLWWELADIAVFVDLFRRPHERTEDTTASFGYLTDSVRSL